ncbi:MAG: sugar transporter permease, partial [Clostridiales bacterium]|nr:sugar transporter permease [Clostridiales bacterium]
MENIQIRALRFQRIKRDFIRNKYVYLMALPIIAYYIIFHYIPMGGVVIAFQNYTPKKGFLHSDWVGLKHFVSFLTSYQSLRVIKNTLTINIYEILFGFPAPILLALLLNEITSMKYKRVIQTVSYLPHFISLVVICGIITDFSLTNGLFNDIIVFFGGERANLLMQKELFRTIFVSSGIWQGVGWGSIIYLSTLSGIDPNLYEAAAIDGAGRFKQLLHITLPALIPTITVLLIMRLGHIMSQGFEKIILLYNPLTYETADVISSYVYRRGLQESDYSFGA